MAGEPPVDGVPALDEPARLLPPSPGSMDRLAQSMVRWIKLVAWVMGLTLVSIELVNAPLSRIAENLDNSGLIKIGLVIFFFGWLWGATSDTEIQRIGYWVDPDDASLGWKEISGIAVFLIVFAGLFVLHNNPVLFQAALLVFILVNVVTWRIIINRTRTIIRGSIEDFLASDRESEANVAIAKLLTVVQYMNGPWQRYRFLTLVLLAALQVVVAVLVSNGILTGWASGRRFLNVPAEMIVGYLPGLLFIAYVMISEIWMKIYRIKVFADLSAIDFVNDVFQLSRRPDSDLRRAYLNGTFDLTPCPNRSYVGHGPVKWLLDFL